MNEAETNRLSEAETRAELIDPALKAAGWGVVPNSRIRRELITPGRLGSGKNIDYADYVLIYKNQKLAVIEAKKRELRDTEGVAQAKKYAEKLQIRFAYSTNGIGIYQIDMLTGAETYISEYPSPDKLWEATFSEVNEWRDRFAAIPFEDKSGTYEARYYQHNAITKVLEAIAAGKSRILLTMATGTGKTFVAFQLAWKLFQSRWNLSYKTTCSEGSQTEGNQIDRRPRILFLADRNILANQAFNSFSAFPDDALVRIDPESIRKHRSTLRLRSGQASLTARGRVPKNGSIFFTIFQTFMTGKDGEGNLTPNFGDYPPDFFDFIIIDECHRGGANDESTWRGILDYFAPAVQLGLTATPKRANNRSTSLTANGDTYAYFGEPVYIYSLKEGINDGFLTPFKVKQIETTLDEYIYSLEDTVIEGETEEGKLYTEKDFNRIIEIEERERYRVNLLMEAIDQNQKTLVFCANQDHALAIRDLINQMKISTDINYCVRVTANDGKLGEQYLSNFQDNEKRIPTILTTSHKLSTGVDARNVRNIVLMRPINSMIEFKQIIGRGTRLFEGKNYFTIYDFVGAYQHFNDPEWDGEPEAPTPITPREKHSDFESDRPSISACSEEPQPQKLKIKLADGKEREIQHTMATSFWSADGKPLSATEFIERLFGYLPELFKNESELRELWSLPDTREKLLECLAEKGYGLQELIEISRIINAEKSDIYDVLAYIAYASTPLTRRERVMANKRRIFSNYNDKQQEFLDFILEQYIKEGVNELNPDKLPQLIELKYRAIYDAIQELGRVADIRQMFINFQRYLYQKDSIDYVVGKFK